MIHVVLHSPARLFKFGDSGLRKLADEDSVALHDSGTAHKILRGVWNVPEGADAKVPRWVVVKIMVPFWVP